MAVYVRAFLSEIARFGRSCRLSDHTPTGTRGAADAGSGFSHRRNGPGRGSSHGRRHGYGRGCRARHCDTGQCISGRLRGCRKHFAHTFLYGTQNQSAIRRGARSEYRRRVLRGPGMVRRHQLDVRMVEQQPAAQLLADLRRRPVSSTSKRAAEDTWAANRAVRSGTR